MEPKTTIEIEECRCSNCGALANRASDIVGGKQQIKDGDFTICIDCGHVMAFNADLTMRELTDEENKNAEHHPQLQVIKNLILFNNKRRKREYLN